MDSSSHPHSNKQNEKGSQTPMLLWSLRSALTRIMQYGIIWGMKIKSPKKLFPIRINLSKLGDAINYLTFAFAFFNFLIPVGIHLFTGKHTFAEADGIRVGAAVWVGIAFMHYKGQEVQRTIRLYAEGAMQVLADENTKLTQVNSVLVKILDNIDKKVLAQHGITIKTHKERTVN